MGYTVFSFASPFFFLVERRKRKENTHKQHTATYHLDNHKVVCFLPSVLSLKGEDTKEERNTVYPLILEVLCCLSDFVVKLRIALFRHNSLVTLCNRSLLELSCENIEKASAQLVFKVC